MGWTPSRGQAGAVFIRVMSLGPTLSRKPMAGELHMELTHQCVLSAICMSSFDIGILAIQEPSMNESPRRKDSQGAPVESSQL